MVPEQPNETISPPNPEPPVQKVSELIGRRQLPALDLMQPFLAQQIHALHLFLKSVGILFRDLEEECGLVPVAGH